MRALLVPNPTSLIWRIETSPAFPAAILFLNQVLNRLHTEGHVELARIHIVSMFASYVAFMLWFFADRNNHREVGDSYRGMGIYIWWPLILPIYYAQTRGRKAAFNAVFAIAFILIAASLAADLLARLASR